MSLNKKKLIIYGNGHIAETVFYSFKDNKDYDFVGFCVEKKFITSKTLCNLPIIEFEEIEIKFKQDDVFFITAIGYQNMNSLRDDIYKKIKEKRYKFTNLISKNSIINETCELGENNIIFEGNNIQAKTIIGNNNILWSGNHIGHHTIIQNNCFISSHVVVSGSCKINNNVFIGVNATLIDNILVGEKAFIGPGTLVLKNIESYSVLTCKNSILSKATSNKLKL
jgi:sugar O-acyltransferase (sialic acid O-acetyltransferase NeuD family)